MPGCGCNETKRDSLKQVELQDDDDEDNDDDDGGGAAAAVSASSSSSFATIAKIGYRDTDQR